MQYMAAHIYLSIIDLAMITIIGALSVLIITTASEESIDSEEYLTKLCGNKQLSHDTSCHETKRTNDVKSIDDRKKPVPENSIYFIDISCNGVLNLRQACSVESVARAHPHRAVNVLFAGPVTMRCLKTSPMYELLSYENVNLYRVHVNEYLKDTPLEEFVEARALYMNFFRVRHISDVLSLVTLYKFGGIVLDLDVLVVKPFDFLPEQWNWIGRENDKKLGTALLAISKHGIGRVLAFDVLNVLKENFGTYSWGHNSIKPITKSLLKVCNTSVIAEMNSANCQGFEVYKPVHFYPISHKNWENYFTRFNQCISHDTFAFHTWQHLSYNEVIYDDSLYAQLMKFYCPRIYKLMN